MKGQVPRPKSKASRGRQPQSFRRGTPVPTSAMSSTGIAPLGLSLSLVEIKEAVRTEIGLAPAPPENILASCIDSGLQKYSADNWAAIELLRIVQELPSVPAWARLLAGLFGLGAAAQGFVDIRDGLTGHPRPQALTKFATPEFQLPKGFSLPSPAFQLPAPKF
jgi:hypothetical protein